MFVKDIEISIFGEMTYSANITLSQDAMYAPAELKKIIQEVCNKFLQNYSIRTPIYLSYDRTYTIPPYEIDDINDINERIIEEISSKANSRYIDDGEVISFWCESTKQNIYIRDPRRWKYNFEKSLFNLNVTYSEKHIGKYSNFSNKI